MVKVSEGEVPHYAARKELVETGMVHSLPQEVESEEISTTHLYTSNKI